MAWSATAGTRRTGGLGWGHRLPGPGLAWALWCLTLPGLTTTAWLDHLPGRPARCPPAADRWATLGWCSRSAATGGGRGHDAATQAARDCGRERRPELRAPPWFGNWTGSDRTTGKCVL